MRIDGLPAPRVWAERIYRGLAALARTETTQVNSRSAEQDASDSPQIVPYYPRHRRSTPSRRAAAAIWPEGRLPAKKARWFCDLYVKYAFSDRTNLYFDPVVTLDGSAVVIRGATTHPVLSGTLESMLRIAGVNEVRSEMRLLPEQGRLQDDEWFGVCTAPMALTYGRPAEGSPLQSQLLYGEPVFLLDREAGFFLLQGSDGYWGWVREDCILTMPREPFSRYSVQQEAVLLKDLDVDGTRIVRGSRIRVAGVDDSLSVVLPDGGQVAIPRDDLRLVDSTTEAATGLARAKTALELLGVPYLFAGKSSIGLDCSGMVATVCDQYGVSLPRDAAQQFVTGRLVATRWYREGLRPGDRMYFLSETGKISHTGLSLGGDHFVHSSPPGVQINSLRAGDRLYREHWDRRFLGARRP